MKYFGAKRFVLLFIIGALLLSLSLAFAQEEEQDIKESVLEEESGLISSPDVVAFSQLSQDNQNTVELGKEAEVILGFLNTGDLPFHVQYIRGYLVVNMDQTYTVQNFTGVPQNVTVGPEETATFSYKFVADRNLDARDYTVMVDVYYLNVDNDTFATTFYNKTLQFTEPQEAADFETVFSYVSLVGMLGLLAFGGWYLFKSTPQYKKLFGAATTTSTATSENTIKIGKKEVNLDWIPKEHRKMLEKKKTASPSTPSDK
ncbi:hypothetical protein ABK040_013698 [Willaertia magna]